MLPPADMLFEELTALREAADPREEPARWMRVSAWLAMAFPGRRPADEDARQETLLALLRHVGTMQAETPLACVKWVQTIHRHKRLDGIRSEGRDPVARALARTDEEGAAPLDRVPAPEPRRSARIAVDRVLEEVLRHTDRQIDASAKSPAKRELRRTQARAALWRLVRQDDADTLLAALAVGEPVSKERLYKWVERGRKVLLDGLAAWEATPQGPEWADVIAVLREVVEERRADAGRRRK
jgi:hypothetical protein